MTIIGCDDTVYIILDKIMSRMMRRDLLSLLTHLELIPVTVILLTSILTGLYKVQENRAELMNIVTKIFLSSFYDRSKYMIPSRSFPVFDLSGANVLLTVKAKRKPEPKRLTNNSDVLSN